MLRSQALSRSSWRGTCAVHIHRQLSFRLPYQVKLTCDVLRRRLYSRP
jgi:hypothetical protein